MSKVFGSKESDRPFPLKYCSGNEISRENKHPLPPLFFVSCAEARGSRLIWHCRGNVAQAGGPISKTQWVGSTDRTNRAATGVTAAQGINGKQGLNRHGTAAQCGVD